MAFSLSNDTWFYDDTVKLKLNKAFFVFPAIAHIALGNRQKVEQIKIIVFLAERVKTFFFYLFMLFFSLFNVLKIFLECFYVYNPPRIKEVDRTAYARL